MRGSERKPHLFAWRQVLAWLKDEITPSEKTKLKIKKKNATRKKKERNYARRKTKKRNVPRETTKNDEDNLNHHMIVL